MIGVSNVQAVQLQRLCERANVKPMVVQNRCYALLGWDKEVREICQTYDVMYQGFSLLTANRDVLRTPEIETIAKRCATGPAQIIFRFAQQVGMIPLTGTTNEQRMTDDLSIDQFELTPEEIARIENVGT